MENVTDVNGLIDAALDARGSQCLEVLKQHVQQYVSNKVSKEKVQNTHKSANETKVEWIPPF